MGALLRTNEGLAEFTQGECAKLGDAEALACFKAKMREELPRQKQELEALKVLVAENPEIQKRGKVFSVLGLLEPVYNIGESGYSAIDALIMWSNAEGEAEREHEALMSSLKEFGTTSCSTALASPV